MIKKYMPNIFAVLHRLSERNVIKEYIPDVSAVLLITLMALIIAGRPGINPQVRPASPYPVKTLPAGSPQELKESKGIDRAIVSDQAIKNIKERNIFMESGVYTDSTGQIVPDNPYALIAVLQGKERKAVFRDYQGKVMTLPAGGKLIDGFVITGIAAMSVRLQRRNEQKNLRLFNAGGSVPSSAVDKDGAVPRNLYTLIGILAGKEKKAVFKDYKGSISILGVGTKLIDGAVITGIDPTAVHIKKDGEKSELKIFSFHNSEQEIRNKQ